MSVESAREFFTKLDIRNRSDGPDHPTFLYYESEEKVTTLNRAACHMQMQNKGPALVLAGGFTVVENTVELGEEYWNWIMGPESPWKKLLEDGFEPLFSKTTGYRTGWLLQGEHLKKQNFTQLKNFCIATRQIYEKLSHIKFWKLCVDKGVHPSEAFFLCSFFQLRDRDVIARDSYGSYDGWHWPTTAKHFSLKNFKSGHMLEPEQINWYFINTIWRGSDYHSLHEEFNAAAVTIKSKFSEASTYDIDSIIRIFNRKKESNGEA